MHMAYTIAPALPISQRILWSSFFGNERFFFFLFTFVVWLVGLVGWLAYFPATALTVAYSASTACLMPPHFLLLLPPSCSVPCPHVHYTTNTSRFNHSDFAKICLSSFNHSEKFVKY